MPATAIAEPAPAKEQITDTKIQTPPKEGELPKTPESRGSKFREAFKGTESGKKVEGEEAPKPDVDKPPVEAKKPEETVKAAAAEAGKKAAPAKSALDLALEGGAKPPPAAGDDKPGEDDGEKALKEFEDAEKSKDWRKGRTVLETRRQAELKLTQELKQAREQLGKVDPKTSETLNLTTKERDQLKTENAELRDAITALNVEYDPAFQQKFVKGRETLVERAIKRVQEYGGDAVKFADALSLTGKARTVAMEAALEDVRPLDLPRIVSVLDQMQTLDDERADLRKDPQQAFARLTEQRQKEQERKSEELATARKTEFSRVVNGLAKKSPLLGAVDPESDGGIAWNDDLKESVTGAEKLFEPDVPFSELVETAVAGKRLPFVEKLLSATRKDLREAQGRLREYEEASPDFRGNKQPKDETKTPAGSGKFHKAMEKLQAGNEMP